MSTRCWSSPHPLRSENGFHFAVLYSLLLGLNTSPRPQTLRSFLWACWHMSWVGWARWQTSISDEESIRLQCGLHMRRANPRHDWDQGCCRPTAHVHLDGTGRQEAGGLCCCPTSLSPVALHHCGSDTNLRQCPIASQQISHRHTVAINLGAILNGGWGIPCLSELHAPTDVSKSLFPEAHLERN